LSKDQRTVFIATLNHACPLDVAVRPIPGNAERMEYAAQLSAAIQDAGCKVVRPKCLIDTGAGYGLWVMLHDKDNIPDGANPLTRERNG
jgi:hypothetical protein